MAERVTIDLAARKILIDGEEFPYLLHKDGPRVNNLDTRDELRSVTLTFFAKDIEVIPEHVTLTKGDA
ncbi:hypothetical protein IU487_22325 [Nocardia puris]|uniref:hypothetical protein n=1 Tax=Nocardia puris TaxID=208602 RepID=UPI001893023A|nr:hypothetical protein [Nocardia puris]MBF6213757.1 hypothetical protein [Nocardia puris]